MYLGLIQLHEDNVPEAIETLNKAWGYCRKVLFLSDVGSADHKTMGVTHSTTLEAAAAFGQALFANGQYEEAKTMVEFAGYELSARVLSLTPLSSFLPSDELCCFLAICHACVYSLLLNLV